VKAVRPKRQTTLSVAIDTGGTFTDCVWIEDGALKTLKIFSTPDDPSRAIGEAVKQITAGRDVPTLTLLHGTTVGTNALLQRKGARVALVTTAGFEDVIEIGRQVRPKLYDLFFDRVEPLVKRAMRFGVRERTDYVGRIIEPPSDEELAQLSERVRNADPEAIAISVLFSFANPENERAIASALQELGKPISVSHRILPEFREYERTSTVVINAYLQPMMQSYMERLESRASSKKNKGRARIFVMQSSGGITTLETAAEEPVRTVLSGPAGGLVGAVKSAARSGFRKILSFDMGGTSTDVAAVQGDVQAGGQAEIAGFPLGVPMLEIHTVGAGGGSLPRFDVGGSLRVGPDSAGADPGPICYGGGIEPTVTDANLLLGRLRAEHFLGGEFKLDVERTRRMVREWLNRQKVRLTIEEFAAGVIRVVNANMERALRVVSIERGLDPREFCLVAFGGAGGLHACELAEAMAIPTVMIPARPGALSAFGILMSDAVKDYSRTLMWRLDGKSGGKLEREKLEAEFRKLEAPARRQFKNEGWRGALKLERMLDLRYRGQGYELPIRQGGDLRARFHEEHQRRYGYHHAEREIELVTARLRARTATRQPAVKLRPGLRIRKPPAPMELARVWFGQAFVKTPVYQRESLIPGRKMWGPAVICEYSATCVIPPKKKFWVDGPENLIVEVR
jgi:N-methylhydantoinase A